MTYIDRYASPAPARRLAICLGILASPVSIVLVFVPFSLPFAGVFLLVSLPFCAVLGIPAGLLVRTRIALEFHHAAATGFATGLLACLAAMVWAAVTDRYYDIALTSMILILGGTVHGGIAHPWITFFVRHLGARKVEVADEGYVFE